MGLVNDSEVNTLPRANSRLGEGLGLISSLDEAWFNALDRCIVDTTLSEAILPLMRACFFGGAMHAVLLLQRGHGDQLASDIAAFITKEQQS